MSIIRAEKTGNYTMMSNTCLRDVNLSARAKGVYAYIMSLPDNWNLHRKELYTHFSEGRDALDRAFKELQDAGYVSKDRLRDDKQRIVGWLYTIHETPDPELLKTRDTGNQGSGNRPLLKTEEPSTDKNLPAEGSTRPKGRVENAHTRGKYREVAEKLARDWADGNGAPYLENDAVLFEKFLEENDGVIPPEALEVNVDWYFQALLDRKKGWKTRYKSPRQFLKQYDLASSFLWDWYEEHKKDKDKEYRLWHAGYQLDYDRARKVVEKIKSEGRNLIDEFLRDSEDLRRIQSHFVGLFCEESRLASLPYVALTIPTNQPMLDRFYIEKGLGDRLELMKRILEK